MTFQQFFRQHPELVRFALQNLNLVRLAELADRDDASAIGSLVLHRIDAEKFALEQNQSEPLETSAAPHAEDVPMMLRAQAD